MALDTRTHFHIRWSSTSVLDYDHFDSRETADETAKQLARADETYSIEEFNDSCKKCAEMRGKSGNFSSSK